MDFSKKKLPVVENERPAPVTGKLNGVLALLREKVMREYGLSAEEYKGKIITIKGGELTLK